jgi:hypothetical protein
MSSVNLDDLKNLPQGNLKDSQIPDVVKNHMNHLNLDSTQTSAEANSAQADSVIKPDAAAADSAINTDDNNIVKNFNDLDDETKKKVQEALASDEVKKAIGATTVSDDPLNFNLEQEMNKLRASLDWSKIQLDPDGIPILNDEDYKRITALGVANKSQFKIIVDAARESIITARTELKTLENVVMDFTDNDETNKKIVEEHDKKVKENKDLEKSSLETLAIFQDLSRKTVQELIDNNVFIKQLALISNDVYLKAIFGTSLSDDDKQIGIYIPFLKYCVKETSASFKDSVFYNLIKSTIIPTVNKSFYDKLSDMAILTLNLSTEREDDNTDYMNVYQKVSQFSHNIDMMFKYPYQVVSQYDEFFTKMYTTEDTYKPRDFSDKIKLGWPTVDSVKDYFKCFDIYLKNYDKIISYNNNYEILIKYLSDVVTPSIYNYCKQLENGRKNTLTRRVKTFTNYIFANALLETLALIVTKKKPQKKNPDDPKSKEMELVDVTDNEAKRSLLLILIFVVLQATYVDNYSHIYTKMNSTITTNNPSGSDVSRDAIRFISSEFILSIDTVLRYDDNADPKVAIKDFINKEWIEQLGEESINIISAVDYSKARKQTVLASSALLTNAMRYIWLFLNNVVGLTLPKDQIEFLKDDYGYAIIDPDDFYKNLKEIENKKNEVKESNINASKLNDDKSIDNLVSIPIVDDSIKLTDSVNFDNTVKPEDYTTV